MLKLLRRTEKGLGLEKLKPSNILALPVDCDLDVHTIQF